MSIRTDVTVEYIHRYEYRAQDSNGKWSEPEIRYHNPTDSREWALKRHEECKDSTFSLGSELDTSKGYSWKNCKLVKRTTRVIVEEEEL